ncbi:glutathione hydrolase 6-like [Pararge aegeria]|uniref:glutathione hydrolase 6-like n=1 Tax=Pararge aegeria TaxID=116150 RepID=UPI0019CFC4D8|nr:glutathione hydrolase 6-like [Pararge aegeria]
MSSPDLQATPGAVELREDVPLQAGARAARRCGGPRLVLGAFAALTLAVTAALLTQIHYGDYEVVPHGAVSAGAACSEPGAAALRAGGRAADAAAAAALCLAVLAPHRTSLDASGALLYWDYRASRTQAPAVAEWGGEPDERAGRPPRLLLALAALHARFGALPWADALRPAAALARAGYPVSAALAAAAAARGRGGYAAGARRAEPALAAYLEALQSNTSSELCAAWRCASGVRWSLGGAERAGAWRVWAAGAGARALPALRAALANLTALHSALAGMAQADGGAAAPGGVASGLAVVDPRDTYAALVTGLSTPFGSSVDSTTDSAAVAWTRDEPAAPLDLAPAIIADQHVCGTRFVLGAEAAGALAQGAAALLAGGDAAGAVERARLLPLAGALRPEPAAPPAPQPPAVNFVRQRGDALLSHADSRGGGVASRF